MTSKKQNIVILIVLFLISIFVRLPNMEDEMGRHHEWLSAHVLLVGEIYEQSSPADYFYAPVWNFNNPGDIAWAEAHNLRDQKGNTYYTSYPPLAFLIPYFTLQPFGGVSVTGLRILGIVNHFLCCLLIFFIINKVFDKDWEKELFMPSLLGVALYLFSAGNLWFHTQVYFADMQVHLFILLQFYFLVQYLKERISFKKAAIGFFIFTVLGVYTEWIAVFTSFFLCILFFVKSFNRIRGVFEINYRRLSLVLIIGLTTLLTIGFTLYQYSQIAGWDTLLETLTDKYTTRSGMSESKAEYGRSMNNVFSWVMLSNHYEINYHNLLDFTWFSLIVSAIFFLKKKFRMMLLQYKEGLLLLLVLTASIITHHFAFFNFSAVHDFSTLKSSLLWSFIGAFSFAFVLHFLKNEGWLTVKKIYTAGVVLFLIFTSYIGIRDYYRVNTKFYLNHEIYNISQVIKEHTNPDEFITANHYWCPEIIFYAKRNFVEAQSAEKAIEHIQFRDRISKVAFVHKLEDGLYKVEKYTKDGNLYSTKDISLK